MLILNSIQQSPLGPWRVVTPSAWSQFHVDRTKGALLFPGGFTMNERQFQSEMNRAETMRRLASGPTEPDYYAGYIRGLRRAYHGERFGTEAEHDLWMGLADGQDDEQRAAKGRGYRDGLRFADSQENQPDETQTRELTGAELARLASGRGVENLPLTCQGDQGHGPCGTYLDWTDGTCARGHILEIIVDPNRSPKP